MKQVLTNLIRNALKHGCDPKRPKITVSSPPIADGRLAAIRVYDNGPGIAPRFHEEVFLPGRRLSHAAAEGSGMGLAIVKKFATELGGTLELDSEEGKGSTFTVVLPRKSRKKRRLKKFSGGNGS